MSWKEWVSILGTILTAIATVITVATAFRTRKYRDQVKFDIRKINLAGAIDNLKRAQDEIRKLPTNQDSTIRGIRITEVIKEIRSRFDFAMGVLAFEGPDSDIRKILTKAQNELNSYEVSFNNNALEPQRVFDLQTLMQDAVSISNSRVFQLEGKA